MGLPNPDAYWVDFEIDGKHDSPLFVYDVPNLDKSRLATIILAYFHRCEIEFASILILEDRTDIPRLDFARTSNFGGEYISSLESITDLSRELL